MEINQDLISRQRAIDELNVGADFLRRVVDNTDVVGPEREKFEWGLGLIESCISDMKDLPPAQPEDYTELKQEFLRMASYIDALLECSDEEKETLNGFISRLAEFMPWTERD